MKTPKQIEAWLKDQAWYMDYSREINLRWSNDNLNAVTAGLSGKWGDLTIKNAIAWTSKSKNDQRKWHTRDGEFLVWLNGKH